MTEGLPKQGAQDDSPQPIYRFIEKEPLTQAAQQEVKKIRDPHGMVTLYTITEASLRQRQLSSKEIVDVREKLAWLSSARGKAAQEIDVKSREGNQKIPLGKVTEVLVFYRPGWSGYLHKERDTLRKTVPAVFSVFLSTDAGYIVPLSSLEAAPLTVVDPNNQEGLVEREQEVTRKIQKQLNKVREVYGSYVLGKTIVARNTGYSTRNIVKLDRGDAPSWKVYGEIRKSK